MSKKKPHKRLARIPLARLDRIETELAALRNRAGLRPSGLPEVEERVRLLEGAVKDLIAKVFPEAVAEAAKTDGASRRRSPRTPVRPDLA